MIVLELGRSAPEDEKGRVRRQPVGRDRFEVQRGIGRQQVVKRQPQGDESSRRSTQRVEGKQGITPDILRSVELVDRAHRERLILNAVTDRLRLVEIHHQGSAGHLVAGQIDGRGERIGSTVEGHGKGLIAQSRREGAAPTAGWKRLGLVGIGRRHKFKGPLIPGVPGHRPRTVEPAVDQETTIGPTQPDPVRLQPGLRLDRRDIRQGRIIKR